MSEEVFVSGVNGSSSNTIIFVLIPKNKNYSLKSASETGLFDIEWGIT